MPEPCEHPIESVEVSTAMLQIGNESCQLNYLGKCIRCGADLSAVDLFVVAVREIAALKKEVADAQA